MNKNRINYLKSSSLFLKIVIYYYSQKRQLHSNNRKKADNLTELRRLAFENLDETVLLILEQTLDYLEKTGKEIDRHTIMTRDYYKKMLRSSE